MYSYGLPALLAGRRINIEVYVSLSLGFELQLLLASVGLWQSVWCRFRIPCSGCSLAPAQAEMYIMDGLFAALQISDLGRCGHLWGARLPAFKQRHTKERDQETLKQTSIQASPRGTGRSLYCGCCQVHRFFLVTARLRDYRSATMKIQCHS